ncbi:MAG: hypothetical protein AAF236_05080 [Verrucomicrobiota bacterium]
MADSLLSGRADYGRTFSTTLWIVVTLAAIQIGAVTWAVMKRSPAERVVVAEAAPAPVAAVVSPVPPPISPDAVLPSEVPVTVLSEVREEEAEEVPEPALVPPSGLIPTSPEMDLPLPLPGSSEPLAAIADPVLAPLDDTEEITRGPLAEPQFFGPVAAPAAEGTSDSLSDALQQAHLDAPPIEDLILARLVSTGAEHRDGGNMQKALEALREVETALPEHPRVLSEMAATYQQMGLDSRAANYWERVLELGPVRAASYYEVADRALRLDTPTEVVANAPVLSLGQIDVEQFGVTDDGERVSVKVEVISEPDSFPSAAEVDLNLYFFDEVDGDRIEASTANTSNVLPSAPYDWAEGSEDIIVEYHQPIFSEEQQRDLGERRYFGYVVELSYRDQLQATAVYPPELEDLPDPENIGEVLPESVENSLFPTTGPR